MEEKKIYILNSGRSKVAIIINYSVFHIGTDIDMRCEPEKTSLLNKIETEWDVDHHSSLIGICSYVLVRKIDGWLNAASNDKLLRWKGR